MRYTNKRGEQVNTLSGEVGFDMLVPKESFMFTRLTDGMWWTKHLTGNEYKLLDVLAFKVRSKDTVVISKPIRDEILEIMDMTYRMFSLTLNSLIDKGFIKKSDVSSYMVHPAVRYKGKSKTISTRIGKYMDFEGVK